MPHGVACSLPLSPLLQINKDKIINELTQIIKKLEMKNISELEERVKQITINLCDYKLSRWGIKKKDLNDLVEKSFLNGRMENNLVHLLNYYNVPIERSGHCKKSKLRINCSDNVTNKFFFNYFDF